MTVHAVLKEALKVREDKRSSFPATTVVTFLTLYRAANTMRVHVTARPCHRPSMLLPRPRPPPVHALPFVHTLPPALAHRAPPVHAPPPVHALPPSTHSHPSIPSRPLALYTRVAPRSSSSSSASPLSYIAHSSSSSH
ncbi:unnamed protein product [Chondrus crispus]|uniref:Uncharacterized protein n=1 Tax=Chondrus crispus TaxID=2769 RepID=S0F388_CHOCR|nr:unnamed protein product [Chondrus crispus]CDF77552.1 unnamed protein product [Chondrus crispus]|eukprot:XP_005717336.1 unnamed protein product [Chondrus crispus]